MRRLNVLFLPKPASAAEKGAAVAAAIGDRHKLSVFDADQPVAPQFAGIEAVIDTGGSMGTREMMDAAVDTRLWIVMGHGLDDVDVGYMKSKGFLVVNCPGHLTSTPLAESAMMFILMLAHRFQAANRNFRDGLQYQPTGIELTDKVLGLIGFGASAQALTRRARTFGMRIHAIDIRQIESEILDELQPEFIGFPDDLDQVVATADFLSVNLHLTAETRHTLDARRIGLMKPGACIINVARGALVDEDAMYDALVNGRLGGAGLDVFAREPADPSLPVYQLPNVVVTPHTAGCTDGTTQRRAKACADNIDRFAQGLDLLYRVD